MKSTPLDLDAYPPFAGFPPEAIRFLKQLKAHNKREWFNAHKEQYLEYVKQPMESLLASLAGPVGKYAPELLVDPKKGMFRIYRDTRFSKNKDPYKTHVAAIIHPRGHWEQSAGLYVHVEPGEVFLGIVEGKSFKKRFGALRGDKLSRAPLGYTPDHPMVEWLRWKQFFVAVEWPEKSAMREDFAKRVAETFEGMMPLVRFVNDALHGKGKTGK